MASTVAMAVGMGWGKGEDNEKILTYILENYDKRLLIDADGNLPRKIAVKQKMDVTNRLRLLPLDGQLRGVCDTRSPAG